MQKTKIPQPIEKKVEKKDTAIKLFWVVCSLSQNVFSHSILILCE